MKVKRFKDWKLFSKIMSVSIVTMAVVLSAILLYVVPEVEEKLNDERRDSIQSVVDIAFTLMAQYEQRVKTGELTLKDAQGKAARMINALRYKEKEYLWINDLGPKMIMHPYKPELDGKDLAGYKDPNGKHLFVEMVDVCKQNGAGFVDYMWPKPGATKPVPKISYVKLFKPWGWIVGSGIYLDDLQAEISSLKRTVVIVLILCTVVAQILSLLIARKISGLISQGVVFAEKVADGNLTETLDIDHDEEVGALARALNKTVSNLRRMVKDIAAGVEGLAS
ncbi:MAG: methyl-accepting chemotaxis protein, partial [Deltaproteobacteria bacterium]|nr:methyl-accepting chemotaxis protein [Deltaproteobacteria bacterium]